MRKKLIFTTFLAISLLNFASSFANDMSQEDIQRFSAYYSNGMQYLKNNQYASAIVEFKKVLRFSPYDTTIKEALQNSYFARAQNYNKTAKEYKKALNDFKSACFYAKYWKSGPTSQNDSTMAANCEREISLLEKKLAISSDASSRLQSAKALRAQGELAASGYDFQNLTKTNYKEAAYENLSVIYKNLNNIATAMDYIKTAIDINPKNPKLHFLYGVMLDEANNAEASMEQYNLALNYGADNPELLEILENKWLQSVSNNPNNAQGYINLGAIYQKQGNLEGAKTQYMKAYQLDASDNTSLFNLASVYIAQKNYTSALETYNSLLSKTPNDIELLNYKADILRQMSKFEEAAKEYEKILAINPNDAQAKAKLDDIIFNNFPKDKVITYLRRKAINNPNNYEAQFNYALELHKEKNNAQAVEYYLKAMNLNPAKEETYINLAQIYLDEKNFDAASEICQKGLLNLPNNKQLSQYLQDTKTYSTATIYEKATKLYNNKQYSQALSEYLKIKEKNNDVKTMIAACYFELKDYNNANRYYLEILNTNPNDKYALLNSAWAYYSLNDTNNAKNKLEKLLALDSQNQGAKDLLKEIQGLETANYLQQGIDLYEKGSFQASLDMINKYLANNPNDSYGLYYKGLDLDEMKKPNEAIKQYQLLIAKNPEFVDGYYALALDYDNIENYNQAVGYYEKFLNLKGNTADETTKFAKARVKELKNYLEQVNAQK